MDLQPAPYRILMKMTIRSGDAYPGALAWLGEIRALRRNITW